MTDAEFNAKYPWVNAYEELAQKLKDAYATLSPEQKEKGDYSPIVEKVKNVFKTAEVEYFIDDWLFKVKARNDLGLKKKKAKELTKDDKVKITEKIKELKNDEKVRKDVAEESKNLIDPFSIFGFFNVDGGPKRLELARALMREFGVDKSIVDSLDKFTGIPVENYTHRIKNLDFEDKDKNKSLWKLFGDILEWQPDTADDSAITRLAKQIQNIENGFTPRKGDTGNKIDKINGFRESRIYLFWVQPRKFLPLDGRSISYLDFKNYSGINAMNLNDAKYYLKKCAELLKDNTKPFASFVDLSQAAYEFSNVNGKAERLLKANHNIVLHGAPGTGKTYMAKKIAESMGAVFEQVQFHPSYDYTDFVEGLRPVQKKGAAVAGNVGFELKDGTFKSFCEKALKELNKIPDPDKAQKFVFIIDEINRGDISKIFGELFFSIDPGYRGIQGAVLTQYSNMVNEPNLFDNTLNEETEKRAAETTDDEKEKVEDAKKNCKKHGHFFVPENVYIIGTMNDIDRSVESMDFAFRRRFAWLEVLPKDRVEILQENLGDKAEEAKKRMNNLNKAICENPNLGHAYQIGPAYFLKVKDYGGKPWNALWEYHLEGLLHDYLRGTESDSKNEQEKLKDLRDAYDSGDYDVDDNGEDESE